jgi:hypothetical protein
MKDLTPSPVLSSFLVALVAVIVLTLVMLTAPAYAGKHPYPELTDEIDNAILRILNKHGMPVSHDRSNPWLGLATGADAWIGGDPKYIVYFYQTDEIPRAAQLEVIDYLMTLHVSRGRRETLRLEMRRGVRTHTISKPKPDSELTLHKRP